MKNPNLDKLEICAVAFVIASVGILVIAVAVFAYLAFTGG